MVRFEPERFVHVIYCSICNCLPLSVSLHVCMSSVSCFLQRTLQRTSRTCYAFRSLILVTVLLWCKDGGRICLFVDSNCHSRSFFLYLCESALTLRRTTPTPTPTMCCAHPCVKVSGLSRKHGRIFGLKTRTVVGVPIYSCLLLTALLFTIYIDPHS